MQQYASRMFQFFSCFLVIASIVFTLTQSASAQFVPRFTASDISMEVAPKNPDAFENVTLKLETFSIDLDIHHITWFVNDEEKSSGIGKKSITVTVGNYGEGTSVEAVIKAQDGRLVRKTITLRPATVDVLWEAADSYVPPFYKGKALPARGAVLKFTAIPNLVVGDMRLDPRNLDYTWQWNYQVKENSSGYNKQSFGVKNLFINREEIVSVDVQNSSANVRGTGSTKLTFTEPEIIFYDLFPTTGNLNLGAMLHNNAPSEENPITLGIAPFFFSVRPNQTLDSLSYRWQINKNIVASDQTTNKNRLSITPQGRGGIDINVEIQQPDEDFQQSSTSLNLRLR